MATANAAYSAANSVKTVKVTTELRVITWGEPGGGREASMTVLSAVPTALAVLKR